MFQMDNRMWNVFLKTGNVEAYLAMKQLERTSDDDNTEAEQDVSIGEFEKKH